MTQHDVMPAIREAGLYGFLNGHPVAIGQHTCIYCNGPCFPQRSFHAEGCARDQSEDRDVWLAGSACARDGDSCFAPPGSLFWCGWYLTAHRLKVLETLDPETDQIQVVPEGSMLIGPAPAGATLAQLQEPASSPLPSSPSPGNPVRPRPLLEWVWQTLFWLVFLLGCLQALTWLGRFVLWLGVHA